MNALSDSLLITKKINDIYEVKDLWMKRYVEAVCKLANTFATFKVVKIPRSENRQADVLNKLSYTTFKHLSSMVLIEVLKSRSIDTKEIMNIRKETPNWMTTYYDFIQNRDLP